MVSNNHREAVAVKDSSLVPMPVSVSQLLPTTPLSPSIEKGPDTCSVLLLPCFNWATLVDAVGEECLQDLLLFLHQWMEQHLGLYHVINKKNIVCIRAYLSVSLVGFICGVLFCKETNQRFGYFQVSEDLSVPLFLPLSYFTVFFFLFFFISPLIMIFLLTVSRAQSAPLLHNLLFLLPVTEIIHNFKCSGIHFCLPIQIRFMYKAS